MTGLGSPCWSELFARVGRGASLIVLCASCASSPPPDPSECEILTRPGERAQGDVLVDYSDDIVGRAPERFSASTVSADAEHVTLHGCGSSATNDLWQMSFTWNRLPPSGEYPAQVFLDDQDGVVIFSGTLMHCVDDRCALDGETRIATGSNQPSDGGGTVEVYDSEGKTFRSNVEVTNSPGFLMTLNVDVRW